LKTAQGHWVLLRSFRNRAEKRMETIAYYNGQIGSPDELTVPFNDRTHFFGDGVYDAAMGVNGRVFLIDEHLDRFYSSAAIFGINVPMERDELGSLLHDLLARVEGPSHLVYWQVSRGIQLRGHAYDPAIPGVLSAVMIPDPIGDPDVPFKLITHEDLRFGYCHVKTLNLMPAVQYAQLATLAGADETVLHRDGIVTECAHSNVSILRGGTLYSHPNDNHILRGIAKTHLIQACYREGVEVMERAFTLDELMEADEVIVTASSHPCTFASEVDGVPVGGHDPQTLARLQQATYKELFDYCGIDAVPR